MAWRSVSLGPKERGALTAPICFGLSTAFSGERHTHRWAVVATAMIHENCESALLALSMSPDCTVWQPCASALLSTLLAAYAVESVVKN